jgi:hypothetical protein
MARGGYVSSKVGITMLARAIGDRTEATRLIAEALISGAIEARGRRQIYGEPEANVDVQGKMILRDLLAYDPPMTLSDPEKIPVAFWRDAEPRDRSQWELETGFVLGSARGEDRVAYEDLRLREQNLNRLIKLRRPVEAKTAGEPRSDWREWVAALVSLALENKFTAHTSQTALLDLISIKLAEWDLPSEGKPPSTVNVLLRRVLERCRENPPSLPSKHPIAPKP